MFKFDTIMQVNVLDVFLSSLFDVLPNVVSCSGTLSVPQVSSVLQHQLDRFDDKRRQNDDQHGVQYGSKRDQHDDQYGSKLFLTS